MQNILFIYKVIINISVNMSNVRYIFNTLAFLNKFQKSYINADILHYTVETMSVNKRINKVLGTSFVESHGICYEFRAFASATICQRRLCRF
jgi:hypothetical protein